MDLAINLMKPDQNFTYLWIIYASELNGLVNSPLEVHNHWREAISFWSKPHSSILTNGILSLNSVRRYEVSYLLCVNHNAERSPILP